MKNDIKILFVSAALLTATACQQSVDNTEIIDNSYMYLQSILLDDNNI